MLETKLVVRLCSFRSSRSDRQLNLFSACVIFRRDSQLMKVITLLLADEIIGERPGSRPTPQRGRQTYLFSGFTSSARLSKACRRGVVVEAVEEA